MSDAVALITTAEAAEVIDTVPDNVRRLARAGQLPIAATVGRGQRLFDRATVERFARERKERRLPAPAPNPAIPKQARAVGDPNSKPDGEEDA